MCFCDAQNNCFDNSRYSDSYGPHLFSYCGTDGCHMRMTHFDRMTNAKTGAVIAEKSDLMFNEFGPLTSYPRINKVSCSKCPAEPIESTCPPSTYIPQICNQPVMTSSVYVDAESIKKMRVKISIGIFSISTILNFKVFRILCMFWRERIIFPFR